MKFSLLLMLFPALLSAQWTELNGLYLDDHGSQVPLDRESPIAFKSGSEFYYGSGTWYYSTGQSYYNDFFSYNIIQDKWVRKNNLALANRENAISAFINGKGYACLGKKSSGLGTTLYVDTWEYDTLADTWTQKADFPAIPAVQPTGFSDPGFIYIVSTLDTNTVIGNNLHAFDPAANSWTQKNNPPFSARKNSLTFRANIYNYLLGGVDSLQNFVNDLWQYDAGSDDWTQMTSCPVAPLFSFAASAVGHGYIISNFNDTIRDYDAVDDMWFYRLKPADLKITATYSDSEAYYLMNGTTELIKFDAVADTFVSLCPLAQNFNGNSVILNGHAYIGGNIYNFSNDKWSHDSLLTSLAWCFAVNDTGYGFYGNNFIAFEPSTHTIIPKSSFPSGSTQEQGFSLNGKGYAVMQNGSNLEVWSFDPSSNQWIQKNNFPGGVREGCGIMSIGGKGYLYSGFSADSGYSINDFWEYNDVNDSWIQKTAPVTTGRANAICSGGNFTGYVGMGAEVAGSDYGDLFEYNPATDTWTALTNPLTAYRSVFNFVYNDELYVGGGGQRYPGGDYLPHYSIYRYTTSLINAVMEPENKKIFKISLSDYVLKISSPIKINSVEIFNLSGQIVYSSSGKGENEIFVNLNNLSKGIYAVRCNNTYSEKVLIQ